LPGLNFDSLHQGLIENYVANGRNVPFREQLVGGARGQDVVRVLLVRQHLRLLGRADARRRPGEMSQRPRRQVSLSSKLKQLVNSENSEIRRLL
jgi:hypothetical protein